MDWEYIEDLNLNELNDTQKDNLFNSVTWFDINSNELTPERCKNLLGLSQDILKYKGEQVETLLHELDEIATKEGQAEKRKYDSDTEPRSSKSRKSSSIEYENLEQKYIELKSKFKRQTKINEKQGQDILQLKKNINSLEREKFRLETEIQSSRQDESQSDISETVKDQYKELVETVHNKNKQLSELLHDIEEVEKDNSMLREKLANVRDELSNATEELNSLNNDLSATKILLNEANESIKKITLDNEMLLEEMQEVTKQKQIIEDQFGEFTEEVNNKIDEWKQIIDAKNKEIEDLRTRTIPLSKHSSVSSLYEENEKSQITVLSKVLKEREKQLLEIHSQLQSATKDMNESTAIIGKLKLEKDEDKRKLMETNELLKSVKTKLKSAHERCQQLQEELKYSERLVEKKDKDLNKILKQLSEDGHIDLVNCLKDVQHLKAENRMKEKQIIDLVKTTNKLQESCDEFEKQNFVLRNQLGILEDEPINTAIYETKQKEQKRELTKTKSQLLKTEEDKIQLKLEIQKLNSALGGLSNQILDMGQKPNDTFKSQIVSTEQVTREEFKIVIEENEGLRKGLHEILNNLNDKKGSGSKEIKSETFEQLLRALDVRHVSGWYHPAMRIQAELHNSEGINAELREQLRIARYELDNIRRKNASFSRDEADAIKSTETGKADIVSDDTKEELKSLSRIKMELEKKLEKLTLKLKDKEDQVQIYQNKLKVYENDLNIDESIKKLADLTEKHIILERKCSYLTNESNKTTAIINDLKNELENEKNNNTQTISDLKKINNSLSNHIKVLENDLESFVEYDKFIKTEKDLTNVTLKYREIIKEHQKQTDMYNAELSILKKSKEMLDAEKLELKTKLRESLATERRQPESELSKKLAEMEVNYIGERQRADHTNNLYELVKEQLQKSETRFVEYETYNKEILHKNLVLQDLLKGAESKLVSFIDLELYKQVQNENSKLVEKISKTKNDLQDARKTSTPKRNVETKWNTEKEQELLSLKHQIVDLQSSSDEKMIIAKLSADLDQFKKLESDLRNKYETVISEKEKYKNDWVNALKCLEDQKANFGTKETFFKNKRLIFEQLFHSQKQQYLGCVPLISEEKFVKSIQDLFKMKHETVLALFTAQNLENEIKIGKEQIEIELGNLSEAQKLFQGNTEEINKLLNWKKEQKLIELEVIRFRRQADYKDLQSQQLVQRIQNQDNEIAKLEEELFLSQKQIDFKTPFIESYEISFNKTATKSSANTFCNAESQTDIPAIEIHSLENQAGIDFKSELVRLRNELSLKEETNQQLKSKLAECEIGLNLTKNQLTDKQSQITFYEKHIMELQSKRESSGSKTPPESDNAASMALNQEIITQKATIKILQDTLAQKEEAILNYQALLKEDRDNHSMAAERMQDEVKTLKKIIADEKHKEMSDSPSQKGSRSKAIEQYIQQVHNLEGHTAELHTTVCSLDSQLQSTREEAVRYRSLANDRLEAMEKLRISLQEQHKLELQTYKNDSEKWKNEVMQLQELILKHKTELNSVKPELQNVLKAKDDKIHELTVLLRAAKSESKKAIEKTDLELSFKASDRTHELETVKENLLKEHEMLKKRCEQLLNRERSAREEIRELKGQLIKRPSVSARSDKSDKTMKEHLQKKVAALEEENHHLKENLTSQIAINESHRIRIAEDFDKWKKQKQSQQALDKYKKQLKEKETELEKAQQTISGFRLLIERLEREKHTLERRIKTIKSANGVVELSQMELLNYENSKLMHEIEELRAKFEAQQHHSGGLGAALLEEKLEAQERKIAIFEFASKGTSEVRCEIERLQNTISTLQKSNLCLETENIGLKMDLEKANQDIPHFKEQIQHLESYLEVMKKENSERQPLEAINTPQVSKNPECKKVGELERTIFVLKRVIERLQADNKRLISGKQPLSDRSGSSDKLRRDYSRLKEQYTESISKVSRLEKELSDVRTKLQYVDNKRSVSPASNITTLKEELRKVKDELEQKSHLLDKVKILLHRAATREKTLLDEIAELKEQQRYQNVK